MSTHVENTITVSPVIEAPPRIDSPAVIDVDEPPVNTTFTITSAPATAAAAAKPTPLQRLNSVFVKAKQTVTDVVSDAQKVLNERKINATNAAATPEVTLPNTTTADFSPTTTNPVDVTSNKKEGKPNRTFKDILNHVKGLKPTSTHSAVVVSVNEEQTNNDAPAPPPKENVNSTPGTGNPVVEQFKRNTALLTKYSASRLKLLYKNLGLGVKKDH